ncbi:hypothetical protein VTN00DRAFT_6620 [Thermoascus crustaceus]|uniref:uncharacterized protein n=1 Tax=Thermoascus crustaceus TaxID=5088 RepID=UPI003742893D
MTAAKAMLDETHTKLPQTSTDQNNYTLGKVGGHNVVIVCLPSGVYGTTSAATVVSEMWLTFPAVHYGLMVGIGGGVPSKEVDIRLVDVVVSKPTGTVSGVVQYDYSKAIKGRHFQCTGTLNQPLTILLNAISQLESSKMMGKSQSISKMVSEVLDQNPNMKAAFSRPPPGCDHLFATADDYSKSENTCISCDEGQQIN